MANFMNKMKTPKPIKPIKPKSEVEIDKNQKIAEEKIEEAPVAEETIENSEHVVADEATGRLEGETEEERIERQVTEVFGEDEPDSVEDDDKIDEQADEKIIEDANAEETVEEVAEEPKPITEEKPKAKKKSNRKRSSKKKEEVIEEVEPVGDPVSIERAEEIMIDEIMPCTEDWLEEKERVKGLLSKIVITEELDPTSVKLLIADMSSISRELSILASEARTAYSNIKDLIDQVKAKESRGSNSEERKLNGVLALERYNKDGEIVNLSVLLKVYREKSDFYESAMKQIELNRQMLITFSSVFKIELGKAY